MSRANTSFRREIDRWLADGLIDRATADRLRHDVDTRIAPSASLVSRVTLIGGAFLCAAVLLFVAANWEAMPRLMRLGLIFSVIASGFVGGAWMKMQGRDALGECCWLVACAGFGAGIALVGQMYHLSGDEAEAIVWWCALTALSAAVLRSGPLTVGAVLIAGAWLVHTASSRWPSDGLFVYYPAFAIVLGAISAWTGSRVGRHLLILSMSLYVAILQFWLESTTPAILLALAAVAMFGFSQTRLRAHAWGGESGLVHAVVAYSVAFLLLHFEYDEGLGMFVVATLFITGIAVALVASGAHSRAVRWSTYAAMAIEIAYLYIALLGTMLSTAGFLFCAGLLLIAVAWLIARFERRHTGGEGRLAT